MNTRSLVGQNMNARGLNGHHSHLWQEGLGTGLTQQCPFRPHRGRHTSVHFTRMRGDTPVSISPAWGWYTSVHFTRMGAIHQCPFHLHGGNTPVSSLPTQGWHTSVHFTRMGVTHQCPFHPHGGDTWVSTSPTEGWHTMSISPTGQTSDISLANCFAFFLQ